MAIFDRLFGRRKKDEASTPQPDPRPQSHPDRTDTAQTGTAQSSPAQPDLHRTSTLQPSADPRSAVTASPESSTPAAAPSHPFSPGPQGLQTQPTTPAPPTSEPPATASPTRPALGRDLGQTPTPAAPSSSFLSRQERRPSPQPQAPAAPPAPAASSSFTNEGHLDGWEPSTGPFEALARFREAPAGLKQDRARRELSRHMIGTAFHTILGPGGDGKPTLKATVIKSERLLTLFTERASAEQALSLPGAPKNGQIAAIPGEVLMAWVLSQPKVQGLRIDPREPDAGKDFSREEITQSLKGLVNTDLRNVLISDAPTPQKGLESLRTESNRALVVERRTGSGLETMLLTGSRGEAVLPVFTSEAEVHAMGTSLKSTPKTAEELRALVAELGVEILRANPAGPSLDLPARSL